MAVAAYNPPAHVGLDVLFADDSLLVLDKPGGLLSVPGRGEDKQDCLASRVQTEFPDALVVHRLDMETSGLLVMARGVQAQRELSRQFEQRRVHKRYLAIVAGLVEQDQGEIDLPLITDWPNRPRQKVDHDLGKPACTRYRVIDRDKRAGTSRIALFPVTGRSHQLRVHLQALGHPILGDTLYADSPNRERSSRLLLHAEHLAFAHPLTGRPLGFERPAPF